MSDFDFEGLPETIQQEMLERMPDDALMSFCEHPLSKSIHKICKSSGIIQKRIRDIIDEPIIKAWEQRKENSDNLLLGDEENVYFTGNEIVDNYLTRMSQINNLSVLWEPYDFALQEGGIAETYKDSVAYRFSLVPHKILVDESKNLYGELEKLSDMEIHLPEFLTLYEKRDKSMWETISLYAKFSYGGSNKNIMILNDFYINYMKVIQDHDIS